MYDAPVRSVSKTEKKPEAEQRPAQPAAPVRSVSKTEKKPEAEQRPAQPAPRPGAAANRVQGNSAPVRRDAAPATRDAGPRADRTENTVHYTVDPSRLRHLPPEDRALVLRESREGREVLEDGTVKEYHDGRVSTTKPDGTEIEEYRDGNVEVTETAYTRDGAQVREVERTQPDGSSRTEATVEKNGRVERTVSDTSFSDRPVEELAPELAGSDALDTELGRDGERDRTRITRVTTTVTDNTKNPPDTRTSLDRTTYSQHIPLGDRDPEAAGLSDDATQVQGPRHRRGPGVRHDALEGVDVNNYESGVTVAYSTTRTTDANGQVKTASESGETRTLVGRKDGRDVQITEANARVTNDGKTQEVRSREMRGLLEKGGDGALDVNRVGSLREKEDHERRLQDGPVNFRQTEVYNVDGDGDRHLDSKTQEYGDYDKPDSAGRTVTITEDDDKKFWTYRRIDDTDSGIRVRSQTGVEGSNGFIRTDGTQNRDGTFHTETDFVDNDGVTTRTEVRERRAIDPAELTEEGGFHGDAGYAREFTQNAEGRTIYQDKVMIVDSKNDFKDSYNLRQYTVEGSDDKLTSVFRTGDRSNTTVLEDPQSDAPARMRADGGPEFLIDRNGQSYVEHEGKRLAIPPDPSNAEAPSPHGAAESGTAAFKNLYGAAKNLSGRGSQAAIEFLDTNPRVAAGMGGLSVLVGGANVYSGILGDGDAGDALNGGAATAGGLGELSTLGAKVVSNSRVATALGVGGKALGAAGAVLGAGYGLYQISEGDTVAGGFTLAAAAGTGVAVGAGIAGATGWVPVAGWAVAGVAIVGGVAYDLWKSNEEAHKTHELEF